jgi:pimeloyl-ACP methyl ester carboxylesterase
VAEAAAGSRSRAAGRDDPVTTPSERSVRVNGLPCRVWEAGKGEPLAFFAGLGGAPRWSPFLEKLATRRRVVVPSLPGFPGGEGHDRLDDTADWVAATLDLLDAVRLERCDLVGASVGGMLAAEVAAFCRPLVRKLVLIAPYGLFDANDPVTDFFAQTPDATAGLLCAQPVKLKAEWAMPEGGDVLDFQVGQTRAAEAAARLLWPLGDRGLAKRLHRITAPTLLLWGEQDRLIPPSYAKRFASGIAGPTTLRQIPGAGHLAQIDAPEAVAQAVLDFLG